MKKVVKWESKRQNKRERERSERVWETYRVLKKIKIHTRPIILKIDHMKFEIFFSYSLRQPFHTFFFFVNHE